MISVIILAVFAVGIGYYFQERRTYELKFPEAENLKSIAFEQDGKTGEVGKEGEIQLILEALKGTENRITKQESIQDAPTNAENIIKIDFCFKEGGASTIFVYQKKNKYYIEQPYNGIYSISEEEYHQIEQIARYEITGEVILKAVVVKANEKYLYVMAVEDESLLSVSFSNEGNVAFKQGQEIDIYYDGVIVTTYPGQIDRVDKIKIVKQKSDIEIPEYMLKYAYSSRKNVAVTIEEFTKKGISFNIIDTNELPYNYPLEYTIYKRNQYVG